MNYIHPYQQFYTKVRPVIESKLEEFRMVGLAAVTEEDVWSYLTNKKWKRPQEGIHIHELVSDILSLTSNQFMTYQMVEAYKSPNIFAPISENELKELLK